jgi:hypothetical protein
MRHAFILGIVAIILGITDLLFGSDEWMPLYYEVVFLIYVLPAALAGGLIRARSQAAKQPVI